MKEDLILQRCLHKIQIYRESLGLSSPIFLPSLPLPVRKGCVLHFTIIYVFLLGKLERIIIRKTHSS